MVMVAMFSAEPHFDIGDPYHNFIHAPLQPDLPDTRVFRTDDVLASLIHK